MKNTLFILFAVIIYQNCYSQTYSNPYTPPTQVNVTVKKEPNDISTSFNQGIQAGNAAQQARAANNAAYNEAMKDNYSKILTDNLLNNAKKFEYIFLQSVNGWKAGENKKDILKILKGANLFQIIDEKEIPVEFINNSKVLFVSWLREAQGDNIRITQLTIKNSEGIVIYESISKNLSHQEILTPLISNYIYTKEIALSKIEEYKKYLDLGVISKEEYDLKVAELKPILLGEN
jgi:hypothetical protein